MGIPDHGKICWVGVGGAGTRLGCTVNLSQVTVEASASHRRYWQCGVTAAICIVAAMPTPVFQQCGTMMRCRSAAISQTLRHSISPPTRPTSGCPTCQRVQMSILYSTWMPHVHAKGIQDRFGLGGDDLGASCTCIDRAHISILSSAL